MRPVMMAGKMMTPSTSSPASRIFRTIQPTFRATAAATRQTQKVTKNATAPPRPVICTYEEYCSRAYRNLPFTTEDAEERRRNTNHEGTRRYQGTKQSQVLSCP